MRRLLSTESRVEPKRTELFKVCLEDHESRIDRCCCSPSACLWLQHLCVPRNGSTKRSFRLWLFSSETDGAQMANTAVRAGSSVCSTTVLVKKGCGVRPLHFCKIESSAGIASAALHWFYFCLTDHKQFVYIDSFSSSTVNHKRVLQGSIPGLVVAFHLYTRLGWFRSSAFPSEFKGSWFMSFSLHRGSY